MVSNASGNFYISKIEWSPTNPVFVRLDYNRVSKDMVSRIGGRGDCAYCHYGADNEASHMPHVYMSEK